MGIARSSAISYCTISWTAYLLSLLCALVQVLLAARSQQIDTLSYSNKSSNENCEYYKNLELLCGSESHRYCMVAYSTSAHPYERNEQLKERQYYDDALFSFACREQPKDINRVFDTFSVSGMNKVSKLYVRNFPKLPSELSSGNHTINAVRLEYDRNTEASFESLQYLKNVNELELHIKSYTANDTKWIVKLLKPLNALRRLQLTLSCRDAKFALEKESFHTLNELEELELNINGGNENNESSALLNLTRAHFQNLRKLKVLNLNGNNINKLNSDLFIALGQLRELKLRGNGLRLVAPDLLAGQSKLITLDLSRNVISYLSPKTFDFTPLLFQLRLNENRLFSIGNLLEALKPLHFLSLLDLSSNHFDTIVHKGETIFARIYLQNISNIPHYASHIKDMYADPQHLMPSLELAHIHLRNFSLDWLTQERVACAVRINLARNLISQVYAITQPAPVEDSPYCKWYLNLERNPLECDCQLAWIYNTDTKAGNSSLRTSVTAGTCSLPEFLSGCFLHTLSANHLCAWPVQFCPVGCICRRADSAMLLINCTASRIMDISTFTRLPRPEQLGLTQTTLNIERCNLSELPPYEIADSGYANVTRLYAAYNNLSAISISQLPPNLELLDLRSNNIRRLGYDFLKIYLNKSGNLKTLYLSANPWNCDCESMPLLRSLNTYRARISDIDRLFCANPPYVGVALLSVDLSEVCLTHIDIINNVVLPLAALALTTVMLVSLIALYYKYKMELQVWLYAHNICLLWISEDEVDKNKTFDAFISYAHQQNDYVSQILLPGLEYGQPAFRICVHERNWLAGAYIPEQIVESVGQSCRTIIVLSQDFIASNWGRMEFRTAHQCALNEGRARIIIIKYGELKNLESLDKELLAYLTMNTYLEWNDTRFWQKLRYALPHKKRTECGNGPAMLKVPRRVYVTE